VPKTSLFKGIKSYTF